MSQHQKSICIVGAGVTGILVALLCSKLGIKVSLFEQDWCSYDPNEGSLRLQSGQDSRPIVAKNLALSIRSLECLEEVGALTRLKHEVMLLFGEVIHGFSGNETVSNFGGGGEPLWCVSNSKLNSILLEMTSGNEGITVHYGHTLLYYDGDGICTFRATYGDSVQYKFDLVIGTDGLNSRLRALMSSRSVVSCNSVIVAHAYKIFAVPAISKCIRSPIDGSTTDSLVTFEKDFALLFPEAVHTWYSEQHMVVAMPNRDKSFTAALYAPHHGTDGFDSVDPNSEMQICDYFQKHFPQLLPLLPNVVEDYRNNPVVPLVCTRTAPCQAGRAVLIGEAASTVLPFGLQAENAAIADAMTLYKCIKACMPSDGHMSTEGLLAAAEAYSVQRSSAAAALSDLSLQHYNDFFHGEQNSMLHRIGKRYKQAVASMLPRVFPPFRALLAREDVPYYEVVERYQRQERWLNRIMWVNVTLLGAGVAGLVVYGVRKLTK